jgi:MoxR-like ATPase
MSTPTGVNAIQRLARDLKANIQRVIVGKSDVIDLTLVALLCEGHILFEDVPGIGKTTLAKSIARSLDCSFKRIQFTPDLLPSDVSGISYYNQKSQEFEFRPGPVFAQILLADEINRATPRTQSSLLEAMQERQTTVDTQTMPLPRPFLVLATQNPIEHEGTYPLPEAQLDRFLCRLTIGYPPESDERRVLETHGHGAEPVGQALEPAEVVRLQDQAGEVHAEVEILDYVLEIVRATRRHGRVALGASPRAALALLWAAKARALCRGRTFVLPDDVKALAVPVLAHRLLLHAEAEIEGLDARAVVTEAIDRVPWVRR